MASLSLAAPAETADDLSRYLHKRQDGGWRFEVAVKGARCASCLAKIESGVRGVSGVTQARLNLSTGKLNVVLEDGSVSPKAVLRRVRDLGYEAAPFEASAVLNENEREGQLLLRCLAVSGFGTVFTMGLTDAIWYGGADMTPALRQLFFWLAGAVAVPLTVYAAQPFLRSAFAALKKRSTNMNVPISLALILSLGLSLYQTIMGGATTYFDAGLMLTFLLLIGRYLDYRLRDQARGAAQHLLSMQSLLARRFKADGGLETVAARDLMPGDRILLASGERAPVNGRLDESVTDVDVSLVTGESQPIVAEVGAELAAGSIIVGVPVALTVTARVEDSLVADLARLLEAGQQSRSLYVSLADRAARAFVPLVTAGALLVLIGWLLAGAGFATAMTNAITVLIITCPCALGLAVPAVQVAATGRLFQHGVFVKSGSALERLAEIDTVVFDKTGTLTLGQPVLENAGQYPHDTLEQAARLARASRHPLARALAAQAGNGPVAAGVREVAGAGLMAEEGGVTRRLGSAAWVMGHQEAGTGSDLWFRENDAPAVRFTFHDRIRPEVRSLVVQLRSRGIAVEMLTGDRKAPAGEIAAQAGIERWQAGAGPVEKVKRLQGLKAAGHRALMVGDGLNDAAAMALAHVSIAPGTATDVSQLASDMVLRGEGLSPLVEAVDVARKARRLALENFAMAAVYNLAAIPLAALGFVTPLIAAATMAGSSLLVTLNALRLVRRT